MRLVEGDISLSSGVLRCHPEQPLYSSEFGCIKLFFTTALVLFNQSDYLNHSNKDSGWLIVACFMRIKSMLTTSLFTLEIKFVSKIESNTWGI